MRVCRMSIEVSKNDFGKIRVCKSITVSTIGNFASFGLSGFQCIIQIWSVCSCFLFAKKHLVEELMEKIKWVFLEILGIEDR